MDYRASLLIIFLLIILNTGYSLAFSSSSKVNDHAGFLSNHHNSEYIRLQNNARTFSDSLSEELLSLSFGESNIEQVEPNVFSNVLQLPQGLTAVPITQDIANGKSNYIVIIVMVTLVLTLLIFAVLRIKTRSNDSFFSMFRRNLQENQEYQPVIGDPTNELQGNQFPENSAVNRNNQNNYGTFVQ